MSDNVKGKVATAPKPKRAQGEGVKNRCCPRANNKVVKPKR